MAALLKLNEAGRINELIEQNVGFAKNLREANEKVERLNIDNNATKDDVIDALRDLGVGVHSPHQWYVDFEADRTRDLATTTDPRRLLNPGKLTAGIVVAGMGKLTS